MIGGKELGTVVLVVVGCAGGFLLMCAPGIVTQDILSNELDSYNGGGSGGAVFNKDMSVKKDRLFSTDSMYSWPAAHKGKNKGKGAKKASQPYKAAEIKSGETTSNPFVK